MREWRIQLLQPGGPVSGFEPRNSQKTSLPVSGALRIHLVELAPRVRPTGCQHNVATHGQPLEPGIAVDLQNAAEAFEVSG
jgi:hypothetical protein